MKIGLTTCLGFIMLIVLPFAQLSCVKANPNIYPLDKAYYREAGLLRDLQALEQQSPQNVELQTIGVSSHEQKPIYALQIQTDLDRIPVLIVGQHHGDEVLGIQIAMSFAKQLVQNNKDDKIRQLLDTYAFWIIPTLNPEGWQVVSSGQYQWKRKNNTDTNGNSKLDFKTDGVDLNRNYPTFWELDNPLPEHSPFYRGTEPANQSEIMAIQELASTLQFKYMFSYHSSFTGTYNEKVYLPWQDKGSRKVSGDFEQMRELGEVYCSSVKRDYSSAYYRLHYGATSQLGNSRNYFYYHWGAFAYDIEVGGVNKDGISVIHPVAEVMQRTVSRNVSALIKTLIYAATRSGR